jgi:hypothetical protein
MDINKVMPAQTGLSTATKKALDAAEHLTEMDLGAIKQLQLVAKRLEDAYKDKDASRLIKEGNLQFLYLQLLDKLMLNPASRAAAAKKAGGKTEEEEALDDIRSAR